MIPILDPTELRIYSKGETNRYVSAFCPFHNDTDTPNLKIEKQGKRRGRWKCWACGANGNIPPEDVLDLVRNYEPMENIKPNSIDWDALQQKYLLGDMKFRKSLEIAGQWGVSPSTIWEYCFGWTDFDMYSVPMRDRHNQIVGIQLRDLEGKKYSVQGSQLGLFIPQDSYNLCPLVVEGVSDAIVASECGYFGIGLPSAQVGHRECLDYIDEEFNWKLGVQSPILVPDNNQAGFDCMRTMAELCEMAKIKYRIVGIPIGVKDLRAYYMKYGKNKTIDLLGNKNEI